MVYNNIHLKYTCTSCLHQRLLLLLPETGYTGAAGLAVTARMCEYTGVQYCPITV